MPIIQSVKRALNILDLFDDFNKELKITEISTRLGLNKSTAHSLLKTLKEQDYIKQDLETGKYSLGLKLVERGNFVLNSMDLRIIAKDSLVELSHKTGNTTHLVILDEKTGVYIDKVEGPNKTIVFSRIGRSVPIHSSAVGKVLVAYKSQQELDSLLEQYDFFPQTGKTIKDKMKYLEELAQVERCGYAIDNEENEEGVYCIAVPIYDHSFSVVAALSMSFPISSVTAEVKSQTVQMLKETASTISEKLGYRSIKKHFLNNKTGGFL
ncbi:IclR family transcriptional regulator [Neobacillus cucumis]|uniref:Glycerol operon regulatory protein n=1 Tax=Neobacillus cucumis TaxID=1740721 RepID=A0A2N5HAG3_9BACI|nr:IclR family transcriptional regulator [Neobacillus cucumis]PLS02504.1 IclR family transcriptional regulator [Neobacillus cucumis]